MKRLLLLCLLLPALLRAQDPEAARDSILRSLQQSYAPMLQLQWGADSLRNGYRLRELRYALEDGQTVSALFVATARRRAPLVVFQHWGGGNRRSFLGEAAVFARKGYNCLLLDAPWLWPTADTAANPVAVYPDNILRSCRAVIAFLDRGEQQSLFDPQRVYYIGHSYGATLGGLLLAAEPRIRAAVYMAGLPSLSASMTEDPLGQWKATRDRFPGIFDSAVRRLSLMEPEDLQRRSDAPVLYQAALSDQYVPRIYTERYIRAVRPVRTGWYATDHRFVSDSAQSARLAFIQQQDAQVLRGYRKARALLQQEAQRLGTTDTRRWARQEWQGSSEIVLPGQTIRLQQHWRFHFPDSAYSETMRLRPGGDTDRRWMLVTSAGGLQQVASAPPRAMPQANWADERQLYFLYWAAQLGPLLRGQLHSIAPDSAGTSIVEAVLRPFGPVRLYFEAPNGHLQKIGTTLNGTRFTLVPSDYRATGSGLRPYFYNLLQNDSPYFRATLRQIDLR